MQFSRFERFWPKAMLVVGLLLTAAWIGFLGFELFKLAEPTFL
jgi:hypothetical protein